MHLAQFLHISNAVAFQANEVFILLCAGDLSGGNNYISTGNAPSEWREIFEYGYHQLNDGQVSFGGDINATWVLRRS